MAFDVVAGVLARSLALLSDAGHMLTDAGALALSLVVIGLAARPPRGGLTYGLKRAEILSGLVNGVTLAAIAAVIVVEAAHRLASPPAVDARVMLGVALVGIGVNLVVTWQLAKAERRSVSAQIRFLVRRELEAWPRRREKRNGGSRHYSWCRACTTRWPQDGGPTLSASSAFCSASIARTLSDS